MTSIPRRRFLVDAALGVLAAPLAPAALRAAEAARTVRHASIGAANMAWADISSLAKHPSFELVAVADADLCRVDRVLQTFPKARIYQDWRELLKREKGRIDSVNVSTPDHLHAVVAAAAMRLGKHVYVQKPLAGTVREARLLAEVARRRKVVTQMGIQISSTPQQRYGEFLARSGLVGKIREVHVFSDKSWGDEKPLPEGSDPVPPTLDWDGWLGVAEPRPFKRGVYHPGEWRRRFGFGTGTLGDMGCHIFSPPYRALALTMPVRITSHGPAPSRESFALRSRLHYVFPGTEHTAGTTLDLWWYDGDELPPASLRDAIGSRLPKQGTIFVGTSGLLVLPHVQPAAFAIAGGRDLELPAWDEPLRDHYAEFLDAVIAAKGGQLRACSTDFRYAGPLTEVVLLGNVAARFPGEALEIDAARLRVTNKPAAEEWMGRTYRKGWTPKG